MHARFGFQPAIGVVTADLDRGRFDAGLLPLGLFKIFDLEPMLLGPARIHAQKHRGPVLALGTSGAGMNLEIGIEAVGFARQQGFEFPPCDLLLERLESGFGFGHDTGIVLGLAEFDHADIVLEIALDLADAVERILKRGSLLHQLLRLLGIVPELGVFGELVQLRQTRGGFFDVKDASSAARLTALSLRLDVRLRRAWYLCCAERAGLTKAPGGCSGGRRKTQSSACFVQRVFPGRIGLLHECRQFADVANTIRRCPDGTGCDRHRVTAASGGRRHRQRR
jgi:hypothetical protein